MGKTVIKFDESQKITETWNSNDCFAYRMGNLVYITWNHITSNVVNGNLYHYVTLPERFRPRTEYRGAWVGAQAANNSGNGRFTISPSGSISFFGSTQAGNQEFAGSAFYIAAN